MNVIQKLSIAALSVCISGLSITGCGKPETPAQTQSDVSKAQIQGDKDVAKERANAAEKTMDAQQDMSKAGTEMSHETAQGKHDVAVAQADAAHKVSIEKCEAMTGAAQTTCKKSADDEFDHAKNRADNTERATDPKLQ